MARRYTFEHDGQTYTRRTNRHYTHAAVLYMNWRLSPRTRSRESCPPYVSNVCYSASHAGALKHKKAWHCAVAIVELTQEDN